MHRLQRSLIVKPARSEAQRSRPVDAEVVGPSPTAAILKLDWEQRLSLLYEFARFYVLASSRQVWQAGCGSPP